MTTSPYSFNNLLAPFKSLFSKSAAPMSLAQPKPNLTSPAPTNPSATPGLNYSPVLANFNAPTAPSISSSLTQTPTPPATSTGSYVVKSGDNLSNIAAQNNMTPQQLLAINPQFQSNPNLIQPGQQVNLSGSPAKPTLPGSMTTLSGVTVNPATGGVIKPPVEPTAPATSLTPPVSPLSSPLFTSPAYESAIADVEKYMPPSAEETAATEELNRISESLRQGYLGEGDRPIPLPFITGRQKSLETRAATLAQPIQAKAVLAQAKRTAALEASKFKLETEGARLSGYREANKPQAVAAGTALINPLTGKTVAEGPSLSEKQALDTFYNLAQTYPDANIVWNPALTNQQNLVAAQKAASASESFSAKNTVYAINPLTGQPTLISKLGGGGSSTGGGTVFGQPTGGNLPVNQLAPELQAAVNNVAGVQYFDESKITPAQLPYLQRASQSTGIPLLSTEGVKAIQTDSAKFNRAQSLMQSILELTPKVITASNDPASMTSQAVRLQAIKLAPTLSTDNNTKALLSTLEAFTSLLTRAAGEVGVLTDTDVRRIKNALPSITDNKELAFQKAQQLNEVFRASLAGAVQTYLGGSGTGVSEGGDDYAAYLKAIGQK